MKKNRCPPAGDSGDTPGVDLNRNFGYKWNGTANINQKFCLEKNVGFFFLATVTGGTSNSCKETFPGTGPFSEPETRNIRDFYKSLSPLPELAMCVHSFEQSICNPISIS